MIGGDLDLTATDTKSTEVGIVMLHPIMLGSQLGQLAELCLGRQLLKKILFYLSNVTQCSCG